MRVTRVDIPSVCIVVMVVIDVAMVVERIHTMMPAVEIAAVGIGGKSDAEMKSAGGEI